MRNKKGQFVKGHALIKGAEKGWFEKGTHPSPDTEFKKGEHPSLSTEFQKGNTVNLGRKQSEETKKKIGEAHKGKKHSEEHKQKITDNNAHYWLDKEFSDEHRENLSESHKGKHYSPKTEFKKGQMAGEKHYNWQDGISFEPYGVEFNKELREQIRERDNYACRECKHTQEELGYKLAVHHVDYDKKNSDEKNLISLCKSCHAQTNFGREDWTNYFNQQL